MQAGPGINDDGSGSSLILELFRTLDAKHVKNQVRFAWWAAEEYVSATNSTPKMMILTTLPFARNGLLGSKYYTETLPIKDVDNLLAYLNFDMVGRGFYGSCLPFHL